MQLKSVVIGKAERMNWNRFYVSPGPGQYHPSSKLVKRNMNISMPRAMKSPVYSWKSVAPGPGAYSHNLKRYGSYSKFGKSKKKPTIISDSLIEVPGPGEYDVRESYIAINNKRGTKFLTSTRKGFVENKGIPGPGCYNIGSSFDKFAKKKKRVVRKPIR